MAGMSVVVGRSPVTAAFPLFFGSATVLRFGELFVFVTLLVLTLTPLAGLLRTRFCADTREARGARVARGARETGCFPAAFESINGGEVEGGKGPRRRET